MNQPYNNNNNKRTSMMMETLPTIDVMADLSARIDALKTNVQPRNVNMDIDPDENNDDDENHEEEENKKKESKNFLFI